MNNNNALSTTLEAVGLLVTFGAFAFLVVFAL